MRWLPLLFAWLAAACARVPDAEAIRGLARGMAQAAGRQDVAGVLEHVAADFVGNDGELDRDGLERLLRARLLAGRAVGVSIGPVEVSLDGDRATARFEATLTDGSGRWLPERRSVLAVVTGWRRERGRWLCYSAKYSAPG